MSNIVYQGYRFTLARHRFNLLQFRILFRIVERAQTEIEGLKLRDNRCLVKHNLRDVTLSIPATSLLSDGSHHYEDVKEAFVDIQKKIITTICPDGKSWKSSSLLYNVHYLHGCGIYEFQVSNHIWDAILDFSQGYRKLQLNSIFSLKRTSSIRLYNLVAGQKTPITYSVDWLRKYFCAEDKYDRPSDIISKILKPSSEELDKYCPTSAIYKPVKTGKRITAITIIPKYRPDNEDRETLLAQLPTSSLIAPEVRLVMLNKFGFTNDELNRNKGTLEEFSTIPEAMDILTDVYSRWRDDEGQYRGKGYVINALKGIIRHYNRYCR